MALLRLMSPPADNGVARRFGLQAVLNRVARVFHGESVSDVSDLMRVASVFWGGVEDYVIGAASSAALGATVSAAELGREQARRRRRAWP